MQTVEGLLGCSRVNAVSRQLDCADIPLEQLSSLYKGRSVLCGLSLNAECADGVERNIDILFQNTHPFTLPLVAIRDPSVYLKWPHVEKDGVICVPSAGKPCLAGDFVANALGVVNEGLVAINRGASSANEFDFRNEMAAYWNHASSDSRVVFSAITTGFSSRLVWLSREGMQDWIADTPSVLSRLHKNAGIRFNIDRFRQVPHVVLPEALIPHQFPRSGREAFDLVRQASPAAAVMLRDSINEASGDVFFSIECPSGEGRFVGAVEPMRQPQMLSSSNQVNRINGFRQGKLPTKVTDCIFFSKSSKVSLHSVVRLDDAVLRSRENPVVNNQLSGSLKIAVIGCGSVGSLLAYQLAQAGIKHFLLCDPEILQPENFSRHLLGFSSIGIDKATGVSRKILAELPQTITADVIGGRIETWEDKDYEGLMACDLVVMATGNVGCEVSAARNLRGRGFTNVIAHGWLEPFACAGHFLATVNGGVSCADLSDASGNSTNPITEWNNVELERMAPGCGGAYQPYGAPDLHRNVSAMVSAALEVVSAELAATTEWVTTSAQNMIDGLGGNWSDYWLSQTSQPDGLTRKIEHSNP